SMLLPLIKAHPGFRLASACSRSGLTVRGRDYEYSGGPGAGLGVLGFGRGPGIT
ncbi:MAG: hypothetical protein HGA55_05225, partial [Methanoregulaceae archaeon]|nr:hypothetical protein [Methanoregulaceae archaeon]